MMKNLLSFLFLIIFICSDNFAQNKIVLLEQFTNTHCPNCANRNPTFKADILDVYDDSEILHIAYHNNAPSAFDPFYQANIFDVNARTGHYQNLGSPALYLNGAQQTVPFGTMITDASLQPNLNQSSNMEIEVLDNIVGNNHNVTVNLNYLNNLPMASYTLHAVVVEKNINFCTFFEYYFDNVFRTYLTSNLGNAVSTMNAGMTDSHNFSFTSDATWNNDQIRVIAFLQNDFTKEIINAGASESLDTRRTVIQESDPFYAFAYVKDNNCANENNGEIELKLCYDTAPFSENSNLTYNWSNGANSNIISNLADGNYNCTISDNMGNSANFQYQINGGNPITQVSVAIDETNSGQNGQIQVQAIGGNGNLEILWNNGSTDFTLINLDAGNYTAIISDENNCSINFDVTILNEVQIIAETNNSTCFGANDGTVNFVLNGLNNTSIIWDLNGTTGTNTDNLAAGNYTFNVYDINGNNIDSGSFVITEPNEIIITENITNAVNYYDNGSINIVANGGYGNLSILWNTGDVTFSLDDLAVGNYTAIITDIFGCTQNIDVTISNTIDESFSIQTTDVSCVGANDGSISYVDIDSILLFWTFLEWDLYGYTGNSFENLYAGYYVYTVYGDGFIPLHSGTFTINQPNEITLTNNFSNATNNYNNGSINIVASGGTGNLSILWNTGDTTFSLENLAIGNYTAIITDDNGCTENISVDITNSNTGSISAETTDITCFGENNGTVNFVNSGLNFTSIEWNLDGNSGTNTNNLSAGNYTFEALDNYGISIYSGTFTIAEPNELILTATVLNETDGMQNGCITPQFSGGIPPYAFQWNNGAFVPEICDLSAGIYEFMITDSNGCAAINEFTVGNDITFQNIATTNITNIDCFGNINGTINFNTNFIYDDLVWNNNGIYGSDTTNLNAGNYSYNLYENGSIVYSGSFTITEPMELLISSIVQNASTNLSSDGNIDISIAGGNAPYIFSWNNGETIEDLQNIAAGNYEITITDANNCTLIESFVVNNDVVSISEIENLDLQIKPNYETQTINISANYHIELVAIFDLSGKKVLENKIENNQTEISTNTLISGVYVISIQTKNGKLSEKIWIQ